MLSHPKTMTLRDNLDCVFMDNMNNDFIKKTGAWPEKFMFADKDGKCLWRNDFEPETHLSFKTALEFA